MVRIDEVSPRRESHTLFIWKKDEFSSPSGTSSKKLYFCLFES